MIMDIVLLFFIGLIGNLIGTLVGGGGLITLPAMMLLGIPVQFGIGTNKFISGTSALYSVVQIIKNKLIPRKSLYTIGLLGVVGGITGGLVTTNIEESILNIIVIILLLFALAITLFGKPVLQAKEQEVMEDSPLKHKILTYFIGVYDGGFGPGSSTLSIMLNINKGKQYSESAYLTRVLIFGSSTGALLVFLQSGFINWNYAVPMAFGGVIGSHFGFKMISKISQKTAKTILLTITVLLIIQTSIKILSV